MASSPITPVILSGGTGVRLWPLSRLGRPKQLVSLGGEETLLQRTARRVSDPDVFGAPVVVGAAAEAAAVAAQLRAGATPPRLLLLEPEPKGTATAVLLAALASETNELLLVLPSDHAIADEAAFLAAVEAGRETAQRGNLVCLGVPADRAETGYGWVRPSETDGNRASPAAAFVEKPPRDRAEAMLAEGGWLWNAGIFLFRADVLLSEMRAFDPHRVDAAQAAMAGAAIEGERVAPAAGPLADLAPASLDRAVMERTRRLAVVPAAMGWSDIGSWEAVHALGPQDEAGNVLAGDVVAPGSRRCLVRSDGPAVVALGVEDLVIVATERAVLVVPRGETQRIQEALDALEKRRREPGTQKED